MAFIRKTLFFFIALLVFIVALLAAADNSDEVALQFLGFATPVLPVSWWLLAAFVIGVLSGNLLNLVANTRLRMDARKANKAIAGSLRELDKVRAEAGQAEAPAERKAMDT